MEKQLEVTKKQKFEIEFEIKSSPKILYPYLSTPSGLSEWFADDVTINKDSIYTFKWDGSESKAKIAAKKDNQFVRFQWTDEDAENLFFQFDIVQDDITSDVAVIVTDFALIEDIEQTKLLWNSQIHELMHIIGS
jgi:uncharacterized protein YndB with AHSA1/START domain